MKVAELKKTISGYSRNTLERIIAEMYKAIPKSVKENRGIDSLILNPNGARGEPKAPAQPDMDAIQCEIEEFLSNAYNQYYFAPNSVVPKRERPKWRFIARRLFKELNRAAGNSAYATHAAQLLKRLYEMLCYSCDYILFSGYDPFESVGISQADFFRAVLTVERKIEPPRQFIRNSILLALANSLNRYTLYEGLLEILVGFLETADMKQIAVEICDDVRKEAAAKRLKDASLSSDSSRRYRAKEFDNNLAILGWMCFMALGLPHDAIRYFRNHYVEKNPEISLYVLLRMIQHYKCWDIWLTTYQEAVDSGIQPREELQRLCKDISEKLNQERVQPIKET